MKLCLFISCALVLITSTWSLNILGIFPYHGKSHFMVHSVYLKELANRGHNVTIISHFPEDDPAENYHDISLAGTIKIFADDLPMESSYWTLMKIVYFLLSTGIENCEVMLANKRVQELIEEKPKFDVLVMEQFNTDCGLGIAYKLGAPVVATCTSVMTPWHYQRLGIPYNPSYVSFHFLEGGTKPTLYQRMERFILDAIIRNLYYFVTQSSDQKTLAKYFDDIPLLENLAREIKFVLLYQNFVLTGSNLFPPNVIEVGGYHVAQAQQSNGDLKKFVDEAEHGVIYISFGSIVKSSTLPKDKLKSVLAALDEFTQRIIWKWEDKTLLVDKNKFYIQNWLPQVDILSQPKTLAFFSHAGMGGTTEALHYGVPIVAMPIVGDQPANAAAIEESGLGVQLQYRDLTKDNLIAALKKVLKPEFCKKVKQLSNAWHDRPMSPLDTAVFWTEFAARNSNFTYRAAAADVPAYQYMNLDITCIFGLLLFFTFVIVKTILLISKNKKSKRD